MILIDGKKTSEDIKEELKVAVDQLLATGNRAPHLVAILVGNNGASLSYVGGKMKACEKVGFKSTLLNFDEKITEADLLIEVEKLNQDDGVDGFIVQLPLPKHINSEKIIEAIDPAKDADGFHPSNFGKMALELPSYIPATPYGIMELLKRYDIETSGKHAVVIGRSRIVGKPMALLLSQNSNPGNCTVTLAHSRTKNIKEITQQADIVVTALGIPDFLTADMVKKDAVIIDVGITRVDDSTRKRGYRIVGDVNFEEVKEKAAAITPVPGGVGPMTIAMLMKNTLEGYNRKFNI